MGVNASSFVHYFVRGRERTVFNFIVPLVGFFVCAGLWWNLSARALKWGTVWMIAGIAFGVWKTRGFRDELSFEMPPE
jgi:positive regulator of sigma E activity